ncbi:helix-turn-helix domain-containing protein [Streptomyces murinus]|uniref:helix-turn-helix domain-containing protein n=1 Tax=Streptomyces murinus TaxID=33900 RepID=UPI0036EF26C8
MASNGFHRPSCAKRLREEAATRGESVHEIALTIQRHCSVSPLRAYRLARGLTLQRVAQGLNELAVHVPGRPHVDGDQLGHWETDRKPRLPAIRLLCQFYNCTAPDLGLCLDPDDMAAVTAPDMVTTPRPEQDKVPRSGGDGFLEQRVDAARRSIDRTLASGTVSTNQLDLIDEQVLWVRQQYLDTPPRLMITRLLDHLAIVEDLAVARQPAAAQVRLSELTAMLATLIADALMKLGHLHRSRTWYATARHAADDSGNTELRARVRAQAAMLPYYYGPLEAAAALAREARIIARGRPTITAAFAAAAEARALAKLGNAEHAQVALRHATVTFEQVRADGASDHDAFGFPERRFRLYESGTLTALGHTRRARQAQEHAMSLYPARTGIDPALLGFEAALCLAHDRDPTAACRLASVTYLRIAPEHRTTIVQERARDVLGALPPAARTTQAPRELTEILALPPGQM